MLFLNLFFWLLVAGIWKYRSFSGGPGTKELLLQCGRSRFDPWFGKIPLEKGMATHSNILACEIPLTGDPGGLQSIHWTAAAAAKSLQSCPTLCDAIDSGPPGSPVPGILQARTLEWVAISFSNAWKWKVKVKSLSRVRLFATPWSAAYQVPPSMGFSRQEYWSGVPLPSPALNS